MTQKEQLVYLFKDHGNRLTLSQILNTNLAAEYRARMTDLRHDGYTITLERGKTPSENLYTLVEKQSLIFNSEDYTQLSLSL